MKKLILCEGHHDSIFYEEFFNVVKMKRKQRTSFNAKKIFCSGNFEKNINIESRKIRDFIRGSKNIFLKAEMDKGRVIQVYSALIFDILDKKIKPILSVDLDGEPHANFIKRLERKIKIQTKAINLYFEINKNSPKVITSKISIKNRDKYLTDVYLFAFKNDLESEANIKRGDNENKIRNKVLKLLENKEVVGPLKEIILSADL